MPDYVIVDLGVLLLTQFFEPNARMKTELCCRCTTHWSRAEEELKVLHIMMETNAELHAPAALLLN